MDTDFNADKFVRGLYAKVGRFGVGDGTDVQNTIDQEGYDHWVTKANSGEYTKEQIENEWTNAVDDWNAKNPNNQTEWVQPRPNEVGEIPAESGQKFTPVNIDIPDFKATTVEERLQGLLSKDNPYIKAARASAVEYANSRGLQNSSVAASAGEKSAVESALPIAQQDASAENELTRNKQAFTYNAALQNAQTQNDRDLQFGLLTKQNEYNLSELETRASLDQQNLEFEAELNERLNQLQLDANTKDQLIESIGKADQQYQVEFSNIATSTKPPEQKDAMLRSLMANHKAFVDHMIQLSGFDFDLFPEIDVEPLADEPAETEDDTDDTTTDSDGGDSDNGNNRNGPNGGSDGDSSGGNSSGGGSFGDGHDGFGVA